MLLRRKQKLRLISCHHYNIKQALGGVCNSQLILLQDERWFGKFRVLSSFLNKILQQLLMHAYTHVLTPRPLSLSISLSVSLFLILSPLSQQCSGGCVCRRVLGIEWLSGIIFFGVIIHTHAHTHTLSHSLSCTHMHTLTHALARVETVQQKLQDIKIDSPGRGKNASYKKEIKWNRRSKNFLRKRFFLPLSEYVYSLRHRFSERL